MVCKSNLSFRRDRLPQGVAVVPPQSGQSRFLYGCEAEVSNPLQESLFRKVVLLPRLQHIAVSECKALFSKSLLPLLPLPMFENKGLFDKENRRLSTIFRPKNPTD